jgi:hypothetical protein
MFELSIRPKTASLPLRDAFLSESGRSRCDSFPLLVMVRRHASGTSLGAVVEHIVIPLPVQDTPLERLLCSPWRLPRPHVIFGICGPPRSISSRKSLTTPVAEAPLLRLMTVLHSPDATLRRHHLDGIHLLLHTGLVVPRRVGLANHLQASILPTSAKWSPIDSWRTGRGRRRRNLRTDAG